MTYSIYDLKNGSQIIAKSVFGHKSEYHLKFNKENDGLWYVDFPNWPFDHHNLLMVAGADKLCEFLSDNGRNSYVDVIPSNKRKNLLGYAELKQGEHSLTGGSVYIVNKLAGFERDIWLCPVTLFVLGRYPKYIYIKKGQPA